MASLTKSTPRRSAKWKHKLAERLSEKLVDYQVGFMPSHAIITDFETLTTDPKSKGHQFYLHADRETRTAFDYGVWVDDRNCNDDVAQAIVDEVFAVAQRHIEIAKRIATRLNREPSKSVRS